jgi:OmpA-OmpF porin, OOP family
MNFQRHIFRRFFFFVTFISIPLFSQENLRTQLFNEADKLMVQAREKKADLYTPTSFEKAMGYYNEARDLFNNGRKLEDIREKLKNSEAYFAKTLDGCKLGEVTFSATMAARTDANSAGAQNYSTELWNKAEAKFKRAARQLEDGDDASAKKEGSEAETLYRAAELEAIKANYLLPARELLKKADDLSVSDNAPKTLEKARMLVGRVETLLKQNRYDTDEARQLAQEAKYEAAHAIYLHNIISKMKQEGRSFEDVMLAAETQFQKIAAALGLQARFENGLEQPTSEAITAIQQRETKATKDAESLQQANQTIARTEGEIDNLKQQISSMENRLGSLTDVEKNLQRKLDEKHQQEGTIREVSLMFTEEEGKVLREGNNIIIRLYGLTFPVGKSIIEQQFYSLLTKVQDAIKKFPNSQITIEGHTDSQGSDEANRTLSESRAKAVAEYLMANMNVEIPIISQGFGESRPVASNDTPEGRAKNRRIDVVITPVLPSGGK